MPVDDTKTSTVRLSARTTARNFRKLVAVAKAKGWLNAQDAPNISRVLNFLIESLHEASLKVTNKKPRK